MSVVNDTKADLSIDALRILALFRARGCQLAGRGLLWQVIATAAIAHEAKQAGLQELTKRGFLLLQRGHRYVLTAAGEARLRDAEP